MRMSDTQQKKPDENTCDPTDIDCPMPDINFSTFILSLNSSALVHLGIAKDPTSGADGKNMTIAKQTIDVIAMPLIRHPSAAVENTRTSAQ